MLLTRDRKLGKICFEENKQITKLNCILSELSSRYDMDYDQLLNTLSKRKNYIEIPIAIFNNRLSPLENIIFSN
jgi:hypothetical protein